MFQFYYNYFFLESIYFEIIHILILYSAIIIIIIYTHIVLCKILKKKYTCFRLNCIIIYVRNTSL